jgi:HEAT repeat protein
VFGGRPVQGTPVVLELDATAIELALETSHDADPRIRRLGVELLSAGDDPRIRAELEERATDEDAVVRALAIRGLLESGVIDGSAVVRALGDEEAAVRLAAVEALPNGAADPLVADRLQVLVADPDPMVAAAACVALLRGPFSSRRGGEPPSIARRRGDRRAALGRSPAPLHERGRCGHVPPAMLEDPSSAVRSEALRTLASAAPAIVITPALGALEGQDPLLREVAIGVLGDLDLHDHAAAIERLARARASLAHQDLLLATMIPPDGAGTELLRTAVLERGRTQAVVALARSHS